MGRSTVDALLLIALGGVVIFTLGACTGATGQIGAAAGTLVQHYCATPPLGRKALRLAMASHTAPNRVHVECAADAL